MKEDEKDKKSAHILDMCLMIMGIILLISEFVGMVGKKSKSITSWVIEKCSKDCEEKNQNGAC
jgi:hypothetical protein